MSGRPHVHLFATGGTIANPLDVDGYLAGEDLVAEVPELEPEAELTVTDVASRSSSAVTPHTWFDLRAAIQSAVDADDPPDGVVVTHGSNTVEETAYFLHLTLDTEVPVALTAAQRNHRLIGNDGDRNLLDAVKVAGSPEARGRGALVVLNDEIHGARDVTKVVSGRPDAWSSGNLGVLGLIDKRDNMRFFRRSEQRHAPDTEFDVSGAGPEDFPTVEVVFSAAGSDGRLLDDAVERGVDGVVVASLPTGSPAKPKDYPGQHDGLLELNEEIPVVLSHRGVDGWPYPQEPYLWGNTLTPQKARILLALGLMETDDRAELQRLFETY